MGWLDWLTNRPGEQQQRQGLLGMGQSGQQNFNALGGQLGSEADYLRRLASGQDSVSAEQLRQGIGQTVAAQQAMAAGAAPRDQAMAALMGSRNAMQAQSGMAGQQALAGIQERMGAHNALSNMLLQQRGQEQGAAQFGYGNVQPGQSWLDRFGGAVMGAGQLVAAGGIPGLGGRGGNGGGGQSPQYRYGPQQGADGRTYYVPPPPR